MPRTTVTSTRNGSRADGLLDRLAGAGYRMTGQRKVVVQAIAERTGAISPEALVYDLHPLGVGRATVYRTFELLEQQGMVTRMHVDGCHGYVVCDVGHHHHLVCSKCGIVVDVDASDVEADIRRLAEALRFRVDTHTLEFSGLCQACQAASAPADRLVTLPA